MSLRITKTGLLDTLQDAGRYGHQHLGINPGGAMDHWSAALANALLGKELTSPVIEMHFPAVEIRFEKACVICVTGGDFTPTVNGDAIPMHQPVAVASDALLRCKKWKAGARCYLAILPEFGLHRWLNSYSTNLKAAAGGYEGRQLMKGDALLFDDCSFHIKEPFQIFPWQYHVQPVASNEILFIPGPEWSWLTTAAQTAFLNNEYAITASSDRMGYRLQGEALAQSAAGSLLSSAVTFGTVQLLPAGQLIALMADHQTTGGYPRVAQVVTTHLPKLSQMRPCEELKFVMATTDEAEARVEAQQKHLHHLQASCQLKMNSWLHAHRY